MHKFSVVQKIKSAKKHESAAKIAILFVYPNVYGGLNVKK